MFTLLARLFAGSFFRTAEGTVQRGWAWLFSSATHILEALLLVALLFGLYERHELKKTDQALANCYLGRKADQASWAQQVKNANAATALAKKKGEESANEAETYHTQLQADNHGLRDYIAAHRLRSPAARSTPPPGSGSGVSATVPTQAPALPTVAVPDNVINTCDADYTYAASAYQLGQKLISDGLAVPAK